MESQQVVVKWEATVTLSMYVYRYWQPGYGYRYKPVEGALPESIDVGFSPYLTDAAERYGIPQWKLYQEARAAAITFVAELLKMPPEELFSDPKEDGVGAITVRAHNGFHKS